MEIRKMKVAEAEANFRTLTEYYFTNSRACSCLEHFTMEEAETKIRSMIAHMEDGSAIVYGIFDGEVLQGYLWAYEVQFREERRVYVSEVHVDQSLRGRALERCCWRLRKLRQEIAAFRHFIFIQKQAILARSACMSASGSGWSVCSFAKR